jgi:regulator of telomere elongation helicase 1
VERSRLRISVHSSCASVLVLLCILFRNLVLDRSSSQVVYFFILAYQTTGTLAPLDSFAQEMAIKFHHKLENPHVVKKDQFMVGILARGPTGAALNSSYSNRNDPGYLNDLGNGLINIARVSPKVSLFIIYLQGLLVFFPSYTVLQVCVAAWRKVSTGSKESIFMRINAKKQIFIEPTNKNEFSTMMPRYYSEVTRGGACFFAVCRGKASEGIDFSDDRARYRKLPTYFQGLSS